MCWCAIFIGCKPQYKNNILLHLFISQYIYAICHIHCTISYSIFYEWKQHFRFYGIACARNHMIAKTIISNIRCTTDPTQWTHHQRVFNPTKPHLESSQILVPQIYTLISNLHQTFRCLYETVMKGNEADHGRQFDKWLFTSLCFMDSLCHPLQ